jgi:hypothetical protein
MCGSAYHRRLVWAFSGAITLAALAFSSEAAAAPVKKVLGACDNTPGCNYSINDKNGDISGCSTKSGTCFYCPNDGKRQCFAVRQLPTAGKRPVLLNGEVTLTK